MCKFKPCSAGVAQRMKRSMVNIRQIPKLFANVAKQSWPEFKINLNESFYRQHLSLKLFFCKEEYFSISEVCRFGVWPVHCNKIWIWQHCRLSSWKITGIFVFDKKLPLYMLLWSALILRESYRQYVTQAFQLTNNILLLKYDSLAMLISVTNLKNCHKLKHTVLALHSNDRWYRHSRASQTFGTCW